MIRRPSETTKKGKKPGFAVEIVLVKSPVSVDSRLDFFAIQQKSSIRNSLSKYHTPKCNISFRGEYIQLEKIGFV